MHESIVKFLLQHIASLSVPALMLETAAVIVLAIHLFKFIVYTLKQ